MINRIPAHKGMLGHLLKTVRPDIFDSIVETQRIETIVVGLGRQGTRHAGLMNDFGTTITAGIAAQRGGEIIHETIPVYDTVSECLSDNPNIAAASIWKHYTTAKDSALEAIEAGIPMVVLITEFLPLRDVRDILVAARKNNTILIGGNTPGCMFPPEGIKIGMLPDVFYPEETTPGKFGSHGATILSRSGAILYHMSDALASVGIAQNSIIGIGGDGAIGTTFSQLVPMTMNYENTDIVIIAGEIGGAQEELLANDIKRNPQNYPKPIIALISGKNAPPGKTMGHAGAIVSPGQKHGTYQSKVESLEDAGVTVVNSQYDLINTAKKKLKNKVYFDISRYYAKMKIKWEEKVEKIGWSTVTTKVSANNLIISGYKLAEIIEHSTLLETTHLLIKNKLPSEGELQNHNILAKTAAIMPAPEVDRFANENISTTLVKCLLMDRGLSKISQSGIDGPVTKTIFTIGRFTRYLARILGNEDALDNVLPDETFSDYLYKAVSGDSKVDPHRARMIEAMIVASVDHGVTPPSSQATIIAASVRTTYEMAIASGIGAITGVHGGAGAKAADFFKECFDKSKNKNIDIQKATRKVIEEYTKTGQRIHGLGHRIHTKDPRRNVLWKIVEENSIAGPCVEVSKIVSDIFKKVRSMSLPINVDGVIGAIVADMNLDSDLAKALFVYGRVAGLSAHYFEEISSQSLMRSINFSEAVYKGKSLSKYPIK